MSWSLGRQGSGRRRGPGGLPTLLVVLCAGITPGVLKTSEVGVMFWSFESSVHYFPQLHMHAVFSSPSWFLCILLLEVTFVSM